jgi:hypothetical protein
MRIGGLDRRCRGALLLGLLSSVVACQSDETTTHRDVGAACVTPDASQQLFFGDCEARELTAGDELRVDVDFGLCLSSSCDDLLEAVCEVSREGSVITVRARAAVATESGACTDDCGSVTTSCALGALPEGSYELRYGQARLAFDVPSTTSLRCAGRAFGPSCCDDENDCDGGSCEQNSCR